MQNTNTLPGTPVSEHIWRGPDGVYRWYYEFDMIKNPTILVTVYKVLGIAFGVTWLFITLVDLITGSGLSAVWGTAKVFLIITGVLLIIGLIAYLIVAALYGGKYVVLFEMDEKRVTHIQMPKQVKKAEALGMLTALAGLAAGRPGAAGAGLLAMEKNRSTSVFADVKTIKVRKRRHTIHVGQLLEKNQVYAEDADFDLVADFITSRCPHAKIH